MILEFINNSVVFNGYIGMGILLLLEIFAIFGVIKVYEIIDKKFNRR